MSPDGTADVVWNWKITIVVFLEQRAFKEGLGKAYIQGFRWALKKYDFIFEMDADLSHDPKELSPMLDCLNPNSI